MENHISWFSMLYGEPYIMVLHDIWRTIIYGSPYIMENQINNNEQTLRISKEGVDNNQEGLKEWIITRKEWTITRKEWIITRKEWIITRKEWIIEKKIRNKCKIYSNRILSARRNKNTLLITKYLRINIPD